MAFKTNRSGAAAGGTAVAASDSSAPEVAVTSKVGASSKGEVSDSTPNEGQKTFVNNPQVAFWKPYDGKGAVAFIEFNPKNGNFFVMMAPERAEAPKTFNMVDGKINFKLGLTDIGEILAVTRGMKDGAGVEKNGKFSLYHENDTGSTVLTFNKNDRSGVSMGLSTKRGEDAPYRIGLNLTLAEVVLVEQFLVHYLPNLFTRKN